MLHKRYEPIETHRIGHEHHFDTKHEKWPSRVKKIELQKEIDLLTKHYLQELNPLGGLMKYDSKIDSLRYLKSEEEVSKLLEHIEVCERKYHSKIAELYLKNLPEKSIGNYMKSISNEIFDIISVDVMRTILNLDSKRQEIASSAYRKRMSDLDDWIT